VSQTLLVIGLNATGRPPRPVDGMPQPGRPLCPVDNLHTGRRHSPRDDGSSWRVWACPDHLEGLVAIREPGGRR
jgi:hypothetical protein